MVNPTHNPSNNDDFYARALASFNQQMALANNSNSAAVTTNNNNIINVEAYAKSLVEDDSPKIDAAVKSYLSLVAARSVVASDIDVLPSCVTTTNDEVLQQCTFATSTKSALDANRCALICARTLLSTINSTTIPSTSLSTIEGGTSNVSNNYERKTNEEERTKVQLQKNTTEVLWNRLVQQSPSSGNSRNSIGEDKTRQIKPSKVLGRTSLLVAYPCIQERFRRGISLSENKGNDTDSSTAAQDDTADDTTESKTNLPLDSFSNDVLPPVHPPKGIEIDQWKAFYTEFGILLSRACSVDDDDYDGGGKESLQNKDTVEHHNDSALLWSNDKGSAELQSRRVNRAQRATEALASVDNAKTAVINALGGSVVDGEGEK